MLQMLLQVTLHPTVRIAYLSRQLTHLPYIPPAQQQGHRHNEQDNSRQAHIQPGKKHQSSQQLNNRSQCRRNVPADCRCNGRHILHQPVQHISRVQHFLSHPPALHHMIEQTMTKVVAESNLHLRTQAHIRHRENELQQQTPYQCGNKPLQPVVRMMRSDINQMLAHPHEKQGSSHLPHPDQCDEYHRQPEAP